jgi:hypothetical protein
MDCPEPDQIDRAIDFYKMTILPALEELCHGIASCRQPLSSAGTWHCRFLMLLRQFSDAVKTLEPIRGQFSPDRG